MLINVINWCKINLIFSILTSLRGNFMNFFLAAQSVASTTYNLVTPIPQNSGSVGKGLDTTISINVLISALVSAIISFIIWKLNIKQQKRQIQDNLIRQIFEKYHELFSIIYDGATNNNINYKKLRDELEKCFEINYILPPNFKNEFDKLYKIHNNGPGCYNLNNNEIYGIICNINNIANSYNYSFYCKGDKHVR